MQTKPMEIKARNEFNVFCSHPSLRHLHRQPAKNTVCLPHKKDLINPTDQFSGRKTICPAEGNQ
jgi:hypothetical protein